MYRALYEYTSAEERTLNIAQGDECTAIDQSTGPWWLVQTGQGQTGFVPSNYLQLEPKVPLSRVLSLIDQSVERIHLLTTTSGVVTTQQQSSLSLLVEHRRSIDEHYDALLAGTFKMVSSYSQKSMGSGNSPTNQPKPSGALSSDSTTGSSSIGPGSGASGSTEMPRKSSDSCVNDGVEAETERKLVDSLIADLRRTTDASYSQCVSGVGAVLSTLAAERPTLAECLQSIILAAEVKQRESEAGHFDSMDASRTQPQSVIDTTAVSASLSRTVGTSDSCSHSNHDASDDEIRLAELFQEVRSWKDDSQQRSWALKDDRAVISTTLEEIIELITKAERKGSVRVLLRPAPGCGDPLFDLVLFYQMETRSVQRLLLLQTFGAICCLHEDCVLGLLSSVLPLELVRELRDNDGELESELEMFYTVVLSMLFSTGELPPANFTKMFDDKLAGILLNRIEQSEDEALSDSYLTALLALNLHLEEPVESPIMKVLGGRHEATLLSEKVLMLVNREEDPVKILDQTHHEIPSAPMKFLTDLLSQSATSRLLYTNDVMALVDMLIRLLTDLSPGEKRRTECLTLTFLLLAHTDYADHRHHQGELCVCLERIAAEEQVDEQTSADKMIVRQIWETPVLADRSSK